MCRHQQKLQAGPQVPLSLSVGTRFSKTTNHHCGSHLDDSPAVLASWCTHPCAAAPSQWSRWACVTPEPWLHRPSATQALSLHLRVPDCRLKASHRAMLQGTNCSRQSLGQELSFPSLSLPRVMMGIKPSTGILRGLNKANSVKSSVCGKDR